MGAQKLQKFPVHLGLGATAEPQPIFSGLEWYESYGKRTEKDGIEGRLVSMHTFSESWSSWEMHPKGDEVVVCTQGEMLLIQLVDGKKVKIELKAGDYAINKAGVWHTAEVKEYAIALFITAGVDTQHQEEPPTEKYT